jgi:hypothetical protein
MRAGMRHGWALGAQGANQDLRPYYNDGDMGIFGECRENSRGAFLDEPGRGTILADARMRPGLRRQVGAPATGRLAGRAHRQRPET